jgi:hypothetical protein
MTPSPRPARELDELIAALVDESITPKQSARLQALVRDNRDAQRQFILAMGLHASLLSYAAENEEPASGEAVCAVASQAMRWKASLARAARGFTRPTPFSFAVAGLVMCLLVTTMAYIVVPIYQSRSRASLAEIEAKRIVAKLSRVQEAEWAEGQIGAAAGSHLLAGHRLRLRHGLAEVTFNDGAVVVVEGPAHFVVNDTGEGTLQQGRLRALVPPQAIGFKLWTPRMEIVDLGTEFGVGVDSQEATEVHVLQGRVAVSPVGERSSAQRMVLAAGQAWKIEVGGGTGQAIASAPQRFNMKVVDPKVLVLQEGRLNGLTGGTYDGVDDVQLVQWGPSSNFGARTDFDVGQLRGGRAHALLRFDLTSLEGKVDRIVSVTLRLRPNTEVFYFPWGDEGTIELHRVSVANAGWIEGTFAGAGDMSGPGQGEPTWNQLQHAQKPWVGSPGASTRGVDFDATPLATASYVPRTGYPLEFRLSGDLTFVLDWIDGKFNGGFLLRETTGKRDNRINFHSSESANATARPQLVVVYLPKRDGGDEIAKPRGRSP